MTQYQKEKILELLYDDLHVIKHHYEVFEFSEDLDSIEEVQHLIYQLETADGLYLV